MKTPSISVVMTAFNEEKCILEAINSILNQTCSDFEFIIIDDGSTDRTPQIIQSIRDKRIKYLRLAHNVGHCGATNIGLERAQAQYIARMDADDIATPERFEKQKLYLDAHKHTLVCGSWIQCFNEQGDGKIIKFPVEPAVIKATFLFNNPIAQPAAMFRRQVITKHNIKHEEMYQRYADYWFWYQVSTKGDLYNLPMVLLNYRLSEPKLRHFTHKLRMKTPNLIRQQILNEYRVRLSAKQLATHILISTQKIPATVSFLYETVELFNQLKRADRADNLFNSQGLNRVLADQWYMIAKNLPGISIWQAVIFISQSDVYLLPYNALRSLYYNIFIKFMMYYKSKIVHAF